MGYPKTYIFSFLPCWNKTKNPNYNYNNQNHKQIYFIYTTIFPNHSLYLYLSWFWQVKSSILIWISYNCVFLWVFKNQLFHVFYIFCDQNLRSLLQFWYKDWIFLVVIMFLKCLKFAESNRSANMVKYSFKLDHPLGIVPYIHFFYLL